MANVDVKDASNNTKTFKTTTNGGVETSHVNIELASTTPDTNSGNKSAGSQRVVIATDDINLAAIKTAIEIIDNFISGARGLVTEDNSAAIAASASVMDDWDESDRAKVNIIVGQAGVQAGAGAVSSNTQRTTLASDDPAVSVLGATGDAAVSTDTTGSISGKLRGLVKLLASIAYDSTDKLKASLYGKSSAAGDTAVKVDAGGYIQSVSAFDVSADFTRPNDTTAYTALDQVSDSTSAPTSFTATLARNSGGTGVIRRIILTYSTVPATSPNFLLRVFRSTYTNTNDNSAMVLSDADAKLVLGAVYLGGSPTANAATSLTYQADVCIPFAAAASIFYSLQTLNAYTPAAQDVVTVRFLGEAYS